MGCSEESATVSAVSSIHTKYTRNFPFSNATSLSEQLCHFSNFENDFLLGTDFDDFAVDDVPGTDDDDDPGTDAELAGTDDDAGFVDEVDGTIGTADFVL